ncbi:MAG: aspartate aminotransferase family protein [Bryobacteraceae bacterium]|nr:aspartate aminotransferase family protein [Bryobacteraceae bacterium]MDW8380308.1 aspartate aminotransferase family protein [Bryobacterales bacterium]
MESVLEAPVELTLAQQVMEREKQYVLQTYARYPVVIARGKGCNVWDTDGKKYLDLLSGIGVNALGHAHPRIVRVIREQAGKLMHCSNLYYHEYQGKLAERLVKISGLERAFFCNSGTEAMEGALKIAKAYGNRHSPEKNELISFENSFHGRSLGAISVTGQPKYRKDFEPLLPNVRFVPRNDPAALEQAMSERTAGVCLEIIQGEGGIYPFSEEMIRKARELCDRFQALFVLDEIQCGVGRPGAFFSYQLFHPPVLPDVMVTAKPLGAGLPIGVILTNSKASDALAPGMHGTTFGGGALACRVALECLDIIEELLPHIRQTGAYFQDKLRQLASQFSFVKEVRGQGLMLGIEIEFPCKHFVLDALAEGLLINVTHDTVIRLLPPYLITEREVDRAVRGLRNVFRKAAKAARN